MKKNVSHIAENYYGIYLVPHVIHRMFTDRQEDVDINNWTHIVQLESRKYNVNGLKSNGTIIYEGKSKELKKIDKAISICADVSYGPYAILEDGSIYEPYKKERHVEFKKFTNVKEVKTSTENWVVLFQDGTVKANFEIESYNERYQNVKFEDWENITNVYIGYNYIIGLRENGGLNYLTTNKKKADKFEKMINIKQIIPLESDLYALTKEGTVLYSGAAKKENDFVKMLTDIDYVESKDYISSGKSDTEFEIGIFRSADGNYTTSPKNVWMYKPMKNKTSYLDYINSRNFAVVYFTRKCAVCVGHDKTIQVLGIEVPKDDYTQYEFSGDLEQYKKYTYSTKTEKEKIKSILGKKPQETKQLTREKVVKPKMIPKPKPRLISEPQDFIINNTVLDKYIGTAKNVVIPDGVTKISTLAFHKKKIISLVIPASVEIIVASFASAKLTKITILGDSKRFNSVWSYFGFPPHLKPNEIEDIHEDSLIKESSEEIAIMKGKKSDSKKYNLDDRIKEFESKTTDEIYEFGHESIIGFMNQTTLKLDAAAKDEEFLINTGITVDNVEDEFSFYLDNDKKRIQSALLYLSISQDNLSDNKIQFCLNAKDFLGDTYLKYIDKINDTEDFDELFNVGVDLAKGFLFMDNSQGKIAWNWNHYFQHENSEYSVAAHIEYLLDILLAFSFLDGHLSKFDENIIRKTEAALCKIKYKQSDDFLELASKSIKEQESKKDNSLPSVFVKVEKSGKQYPMNLRYSFEGHVDDDRITMKIDDFSQLIHKDNKILNFNCVVHFDESLNIPKETFILDRIGIDSSYQVPIIPGMDFTAEVYQEGIMTLSYQSLIEIDNDKRTMFTSIALSSTFGIDTIDSSVNSTSLKVKVLDTMHLDGETWVSISLFIDFNDIRSDEDIINDSINFKEDDTWDDLLASNCAGGKNDQVHFIQYFINKGADVNKLAWNQVPLLSLSFGIVDLGDQNSGANEKFVNVLIDNGIDLSDFGNLSWLHIAVQVGFKETIKKLINSGIEVDLLRSDEPGTALYTAVQKENYDIVLYLLKCGANPNKVCMTDSSPYKKAANDYGKDHEITKLLRLYGGEN